MSFLILWIEKNNIYNLFVNDHQTSCDLHLHCNERVEDTEQAAMNTRQQDE
jgi:hypothetical protein